MKAMRIILATVALAGAAPASAKLDLTHADVSHLPNGLTIILLEDHSFPLVSVQMLYKSGSAAETTGKTGLAHFLEHLAFRASENFPKARATELIYDGGGEWHGYTAMDQTTYFATMPKDGLDLLLKIEADRMARTIIDPAAIQAEKGAVITELHGYENDPASVLQETVIRTALQAHPYGSPMAGYVSDVENLTIDDARAYYASHYAPGNAVLAVVGDFTTPEAKAIVTRAFSEVPSRPVAAPNLTVEPPQKGERRTKMLGPVDRNYFQLAYPAPAASSPEFVPFLVLQEILSGGSGLNLRQSDWAGTNAAKGSLLYGVSDDVATWLPPTREPFLFTISGSIAADADRGALEREIDKRIARLRDQPIPEERLREAKTAVVQAIDEDVLTTEDAAHQLAFFEGIGAFDSLLEMPKQVAAVSAADIQRIARTYLTEGRRTTGWMMPGKPSPAPAASGKPRGAADRAGTTSTNVPFGEPQLRRLSGGLPAVVQQSGLSDTATVELLLSAPSRGGTSPEDLPGLDAIVRSGKPAELNSLLRQTLAAARAGPATAEPPSEDPATRLQQVIYAAMGLRSGAAPAPLAVFVSGNLDVSQTLDILERQFGSIAPGTKPTSHRAPAPGPNLVRERIGKPLSQGAIGYVVEAPAPGTREALAWRMLLYVLTHDYSGRLGWSAISDKGLVYHIYSALRTDGQRSWATISTGVDPDKADAMEAELRAQLAKLASKPPSQPEVDAARNHLLGRDLTAAQSNEELTAKWARQFVETGGVQGHEDLRRRLNEISVADVANAARDFASGTIIRVDVDRP